MSESNPEIRSQTLALTEIQRLRTQVAEVKVGLNSQQEILRVRGMKLPPGTLENLENVDTELKNLEKKLDGEKTELIQLRALAATSAMINSSLDLDQVLHSSMNEVINLTGAERGYIVLQDPDTGALDFRIASDREGEGQSSTGFQGSNSILGEVLTSGQPLLTDNAYKDPRMQNSATVAQLVLRSVLCVPLMYKGQVTGAVYVDNRLQASLFTEREKNILVAFANQAAVAIENARLFTRVQSSLAEITQIKEVIANVFDSIGSGVITTNAQDAVTTFNRAASDILGRTPESAIGQLLPAVLPKISADFDDYLEEVREHNQSRALEAELDMPDRGRIALSLKLSPLKDSNQMTQGVALVVDDLTEQHEREEKLNVLRKYLPPSLVDNIQLIANLALGGERRDMTCMFVDVRMLSTFPPELRPKQVMELLNEYLEVATDAIRDANGVIDKYMGTEIMALWNTQLNPLDDHALRAMQAALQMRERYLELYRKQGINPQPHFYRVGIHSGVATAGNVGSLSRRDFTALGDTINLSHRLLENATEGQIIISDSTRDAVKDTSGWPDSISYEEREPIKAKGRQQATIVYEVFKA
jgi:PAS domain S-box-containing protein